MIDDDNLDTSPTMFDAEIEIPRGIRIETFRHGHRWLCSIKGSTVSSVSGRVSGDDIVFVVAMYEGLSEACEKIKRWLNWHGLTNVSIDRRRVVFAEGAD